MYEQEATILAGTSKGCVIAPNIRNTSVFSLLSFFVGGWLGPDCASVGMWYEYSLINHYRVITMYVQ